MLDEKLHYAVLAMTPIEKQVIASAWLDLPMPVELKVDWHPSGRRTLNELIGGKGHYRDIEENPHLWANDDTERFYREVAEEISRRLALGQHVASSDTSADV